MQKCFVSARNIFVLSASVICNIVGEEQQQWQGIFRSDCLLVKKIKNVWQLPEGADFEVLHCQPSRNFDRSTKLDLTTEPPLLGRCCYVPYFFRLYIFRPMYASTIMFNIIQAL